MNLPIVELNNQRILTTEQLAEFYGATPKNIRDNFSNNKDKFIEGKHYYRLEGEELKRFKKDTENFGIVGNRVNQLILYTKQGASRHSKMLGTDKAWDMFDELEENYFNPKNKLDTSNLSPELQFMNSVVNQLAQHELETKELKAATKQLDAKVDNISEIVALNTTDWRDKSHRLVAKIAQYRGGGANYQLVRAEIYKEVERRGNANLGIRVKNKKQRMALEGVGKSKINAVNKLDVISDDSRILEVFMAVVKDFAIQHGVTLEV